MNIFRYIDPINRRIRNITARGIVHLSDTSKLLQILQLTALNDEVLENLEHFEPHGYTSRPKQGAEAIILSPGGNRSSAIVIMVSDRRVRMQNLEEGETAIYDDAGNFIHLKQDGTISITSATAVNIDAPVVTMTGSLTVTGDINAANITASGNVTDAAGDMAEMRTIYNTHTHPGDSGGTTGVPSTPMN